MDAVSEHILMPEKEADDLIRNVKIDFPCPFSIGDYEVLFNGVNWELYRDAGSLMKRVDIAVKDVYRYGPILFIATDQNVFAVNVQGTVDSDER